VTIVVGAASPDGIVLAADSRTTLSDGHRHRISTDAANKVFDLNSRFGVATYGLASIGPRTINGLMDEFIATADGESCLDVEQFAHTHGSFFHERFIGEFGQADGSEGWPLGFVVAGHEATGIGHVWDVGVPGPTVTQAKTNTANYGVLWRGQVDVIVRLIMGVDWRTLEAADVAFDQQVRESLARLEYILLNPVTLQDAVDMASFLVRTTIDMQRFSDGTALVQGLIPGCGGRTQMLAVKRSGVEWVSRRKLTGPSRPGWAEGGAELDA